MFRSIEIENFRCFEKFKMSNLSRINIITGKNNVGKTSLLEAIFLHAGYHNPEVLLRLNAWRRLGRIALEPDALWGWLFYNRETSRDIHISTESTENKRADVCISLREPEVATVGQGELAGTGNLEGEFSGATSGQTKRLNCSFSLDGELMGTAESWIQGSDVKASKGQKFGPQVSFVNALTIGGSAYAQQFSKLVEIGRENEVIQVLKLFEPKIRDLEILVQGEPIIAADIGLKRKIPVSYMGEGITKILSIMLSILSYPDGYVLIDEIENGFHHSVLENVWRAIAKASLQSNTQVFASTHSAECIEAASAALGDAPENDFSVRNIEEKDGHIRPFHFDKQKLETAMKTDVEVR